IVLSAGSPDLQPRRLPRTVGNTFDPFREMKRRLSLTANDPVVLAGGHVARAGGRRGGGVRNIVFQRHRLSASAAGFLPSSGPRTFPGKDKKRTSRNG